MANYKRISGLFHSVCNDGRNNIARHEVHHCEGLSQAIHKTIFTGLAFLLIFALAGCPSGGRNDSKSTELEIDNTSLMNEYLDVLKSNKPFCLINRNLTHDSKEGKNILLSEWLEESNLEIVQFTIIDFEGNSTPEVIIELSFHGDRIVFYDVGGKIYAAEFTFRGMTEIKKDGTFTGSSGAASSNISKLQFTNGITEILLGYSDLIYENNEPYEVYYINNEKVSEDEYSTFVKKNFEKEDTEWYSYSKDTFEPDFTKAWKITDNSNK